MKRTLSGIAFIICLVTVGCTMITANRTFPKPAWYWSAEAKQQRQAQPAPKILELTPNGKVK
jgi:hypothetical protein